MEDVDDDFGWVEDFGRRVGEQVSFEEEGNEPEH